MGLESKELPSQGRGQPLGFPPSSYRLSSFIEIASPSTYCSEKAAPPHDQGRPSLLVAPSLCGDSLVLILIRGLKDAIPLHPHCPTLLLHTLKQQSSKLCAASIPQDLPETLKSRPN